MDLRVVRCNECNAHGKSTSRSRPASGLFCKSSELYRDLASDWVPIITQRLLGNVPLTVRDSKGSSFFLQPLHGHLEVYFSKPYGWPRTGQNNSFMLDMMVRNNSDNLNTFHFGRPVLRSAADSLSLNSDELLSPIKHDHFF